MYRFGAIILLAHQDPVLSCRAVGRVKIIGMARPSSSCCAGVSRSGVVWIVPKCSDSVGPQIASIQKVKSP